MPLPVQSRVRPVSFTGYHTLQRGQCTSTTRVPCRNTRRGSWIRNPAASYTDRRATVTVTVDEPGRGLNWPQLELENLQVDEPFADLQPESKAASVRASEELKRRQHDIRGGVYSEPTAVDAPSPTESESSLGKLDSRLRRGLSKGRPRRRDAAAASAAACNRSRTGEQRDTACASGRTRHVAQTSAVSVALSVPKSQVPTRMRPPARVPW